MIPNVVFIVGKGFADKHAYHEETEKEVELHLLLG
jgi:hypothetical protein